MLRYCFENFFARLINVLIFFYPSGSGLTSLKPHYYYYYPHSAEALAVAKTFQLVEPFFWGGWVGGGGFGGGGAKDWLFS